MDDYLDLNIDIFDQPRQHAKVLRTLTISGLVDEILKEFDDMDRGKPEGYALFMRGKNTPLDPRMTIGQLDLQMHDELVFGYAKVAAAPAVVRGADRGFIVEEGSGAVFEIKWSPALIGRSSSDPSHNAALAVNLKFIEQGGHISRRHAQLVFSDDHYSLEPLSTNSPTYLNDTTSPIEGRVRLQQGDCIYLSHNLIRLMFFHLPAGSYDNTLPPAAVQIVRGGKGERIAPVTGSPLTVGSGVCDLTVIGDKSLRDVQAQICFNPVSGGYELRMEGHPVVALSGGSVIDLTPTTQLKFFSA